MKRILEFCIAGLIFWTCWLPRAAAQTATGRDGAGKALLEKVCSKCHELDGILRTRNTRERWSTVVDDMISRGAEANDQQIEQIIDYLARNFGRNVNVNKATATDLTATLGISKEAAAAIVSHREKNGPFKEWDDLKKVSGIDMKPLEDKKDRIEFAEKE